MADLLTMKELADRLQSSYSNTRKLVVSGVIPHIKFGGQYRFDYEEVVKALKNNTAKEVEKQSTPQS